MSRRFYNVPTSQLRDRSLTSEIHAQEAEKDLGQKGWGDWFETGTNGFIYMGNDEHNAVVSYSPGNGALSTFVRDPRINSVDTCEFGCPYSTRSNIQQVLSVEHAKFANNSGRR